MMLVAQGAASSHSDQRNVRYTEYVAALVIVRLVAG